MCLLEFADFLRKNPRLPVKVISQRLGCHPRNVQKYLSQLEIAELLGPDPINGRANVKLYEIRLPHKKQIAVCISRQV